MADKEQYMIRVKGKLVEVTPEVYYTFYRMKRQEEWQDQKKKDHNVMSYDALDTEDFVGVETIPDTDSPGVEEILMEKDLKKRLSQAVEALPKLDRELIQAIYFKGTSAEQYAESIGMTKRGVNKRLQKILSKIRIIMNVLECFGFFVLEVLLKLDK